MALRGFAAAAALVAGVEGAGAAQATLPPPMWRDVSSLRIHCLTTGESGVSDAELAQRLCGLVRDLASTGAPVPVAAIGPGDPALLAPGTVTLLVHASITPSPAGELLAFSIRPYRNSADADPLLFAAAPRAVLLAGTDWERRLDAALLAALTETLPWRPRPGPRPITR